MCLQHLNELKATKLLVHESKQKTHPIKTKQQESSQATQNPQHCHSPLSPAQLHSPTEDPPPGRQSPHLVLNRRRGSHSIPSPCDSQPQFQQVLKFPHSIFSFPSHFQGSRTRRRPCSRVQLTGEKLHCGVLIMATQCLI